jgi:hypothetical protein
VVVLFLPLDEETTEAHLIHSGWGSSPEWEEARQWFVRAWGLAFEQLVKLAARTPVLAKKRVVGAPLVGAPADL